MSEYQFEATPKGCEEAIEFLEEQGSTWYRENGLRTDGYTIVHMANKLKEQLQK